MIFVGWRCLLAGGTYLCAATSNPCSQVMTPSMLPLFLGESWSLWRMTRASTCMRGTTPLLSGPTAKRSRCTKATYLFTVAI
ncbi:hypothetical protein PR002_g32917 [Phytophthora rubi]|uniref:Secreted protein n=1 Tax=Phytophthora rubi TaxID=129364 RepID=A0A6A3FZL9_9STRA|nr:hypothetical protein PR002_g32917 [Phytophthora rubi]